MSAWKVGDVVGPLTRGPITTRQLVEYAGASLDFNRIHYDEPFAREGGFPSVIAHGMLSMAFLGQAARDFAEPAGGTLVSLSARFRAVTYPGDVVTVTGEVAAVRSTEGGSEIELRLQARRAEGAVTLEGGATIRFG